MAKALKDNIPDNIKIITSPFTIFPEQFEWFPIGVTLIMGFSAGIGRVTVIVTDMLDLFEVCFQNLDISIDE
jgi:hypothetical protein